MRNKLKPVDTAIIIIVSLLAFYMIFLTFTSPYPNSRDVWFHVLVSRAWYKGLNGMVSPIVLDINILPYPPLFHLLLAPFAYSPEAVLFAAKIAQLFLYPVGALLLMLVVRRHASNYVAIAFSLALIGTFYAFNQMQARPQALEALLYPVAVYGLMENKTKTFIASVAAMFYTHSPVAIAYTLGLLLYAFKQNRRDMKIWATVAVVAPLILYQATFMVNQMFFNRWIATGDTGILVETQEFLAEPVFWLVNGLGLNIIAFATIPILLRRWKEQSTFTKVMLYSFFGMLIITPVWYQRTFTVLIIPMAYFTALFASMQTSKPLRIILLVALACQAVFFSLMPAWWMSPAPYFNQYW